MNIDFDTVYSIKTSYGDEIVTKISEVIEDGKSVDYVLAKPLSVMVGPQGVQMISAVVTGDPDEAVTISKRHCVMITKSRREVVDGYYETTTGIRPVTSKILHG